VEQTDVKTLFAEPRHPYTQGLIGSIPVLGVVKGKLDVIPGAVPNLINLPVGCRFAPRCRSRVQYNLEICTARLPELRELRSDATPATTHTVRCWLYHHAEGHTAPLAEK
jgi:oligopeptide/dipeptide ABC transporter ATP-binding protein